MADQVKVPDSLGESLISNDAAGVPEPDYLRRRLILLSEKSPRVDLARAWLKARREVGAARTYAYEIEAWFRWCDERRIDVLKAEREHVDDYRQHLTGISEATLAKKLSALSSFYRHGLTETRRLAGLVDDNPVGRVLRPRVSRKSRTAGLDQAETDRVLAAADRLSARDRAIVYVLYASGARVSELRSARAGALRTVEGFMQMKVRRKGGVWEWLTINEEAAALLRVYLDGRRDGPLFEGVRGGTVSRYEVARLLDDLIKVAGVEGKRITPHSMRHTFATHALDAGQDIRVVQDAMGHDSIETTMRYDRARSTVRQAPTHALVRGKAGPR